MFSNKQAPFFSIFQETCQFQELRTPKEGYLSLDSEMSDCILSILILRAHAFILARIPGDPVPMSPKRL